MSGYLIPNDRKIFLLDGLRTPFGKFGGSLKSFSPVELATRCSLDLLEKSNIDPKQLDHVVFGNVVPSTTDTLYGGRHLALKVGAEVKTPGLVINRLCGSGIQVMIEASRQILLGESDCVLCSGSENMSLIPHLTYGSRFGTKYGALQSVDMLTEALTDQYCQTPMGITAENINKKYQIGREASDEFALRSHQKAAQAYKRGFVQKQIAPFQTKKSIVDKDEHLREEASLDDLKSLPTSFEKGGSVTPGSASGIVDGAASVILVSEKFLKHHNLTPLAEVKSWFVTGVDPNLMGIGPIPAVQGLKEVAQIKDVDLYEINEAFAVQALACQRELGIDPEALNVWGGSVALGHPLGATGVRISLNLAYQLKELDKKSGIASACIGGGQGISLLLERS